VTSSSGPSWRPARRPSSSRLPPRATALRRASDSGRHRLGVSVARSHTLHGVRLVISDDHAGLVKAIDEQLPVAAWQRCRVHLTRNAQDLVPRSARSMVASAVRMVIEQPDGRSAREQLDRVIDGFRPRFPAVAELLTSAGLLAHFAFPEPHRRQIRTTNPLERLNKRSSAGRRSSGSSQPAPRSCAWSG